MALEKSDLIAHASGVFKHKASKVTYDNTVSGLAATQVQAAIDELASITTTGITNYLWVAKNGNDTTGDGSIANPYLTIQKAINVSTPSDPSRYAINIGPGVYLETVTLKPFITLIATPDTVTIQNDTGPAVIAPTAMANFGCQLFNINILNQGTGIALWVQNHGSIALNGGSCSANDDDGALVEGDGFLLGWNIAGFFSNVKNGAHLKDTSIGVFEESTLYSGDGTSTYFDLLAEAGTIVKVDCDTDFQGNGYSILGTLILTTDANLIKYNPTTVFYVDGNRVDQYVENGSILRPFKTITAALAVAPNYSTIKVSYLDTPYVENITIAGQSITIEGQGGENTLGSDVQVYNQVVEIDGQITVTGSGCILKNIKSVNTGFTAILCSGNNLFQMDNCQVEGDVSLDSTATQVRLRSNQTEFETITGTGSDNDAQLLDCFITADITGTFDSGLVLEQSNCTSNIVTTTGNVTLINTKVGGNITTSNTSMILHCEGGNVVGVLTTGATDTFEHIGFRFDRTTAVISGTETLLDKARNKFYDNTISGLTASNVQDAIDEIATGGVPTPALLPNYAGSISYVTNQIFRYNGGIYRAVNDFTSVDFLTDNTAGHIETIEDDLLYVLPLSSSPFTFVSSTPYRYFQLSGVSGSFNFDDVANIQGRVVELTNTDNILSWQINAYTGQKIMNSDYIILNPGESVKLKVSATKIIIL